MKPRAWAKCDTCDQPGMWRKRGGGWSCSERRCPNESPAAPAPDAGPRCSWCDGTGTVRYTRNSPGGGTDVPCPACAPRPDAAVDQHREGECDCCDEWRRALAAERDRAEAAEEKAADWHRLADERSAALVAAEARAARMEAALREVRGQGNAVLRRQAIDHALSPAPPEWPCVHVARCAWCAVQGPEGDGDLRGPEVDWHSVGRHADLLRGLLREAVELVEEGFVTATSEGALGDVGMWIERARAALGEEADGDAQ